MDLKGKKEIRCKPQIHPSHPLQLHPPLPGTKQISVRTTTERCNKVNHGNELMNEWMDGWV